MPTTSLDFVEETGRSTLGTVGRGNAASEGWVQAVASIVKLYPHGINEATLYQKLCEKGHPRSKAKAVEHIIEAVGAGFIKREQAESTGRGGRRAWMHWPTAETAPDDDRKKNGTPRDVDLTHAKVRTRRRVQAD